MAKVGSIDINDKMLQQALNAKAEGATYTGLGDNMLDFGSGSSFLDEDSTGKRFSIKISNAGAKEILLQLNDIIAAVEGATIIKEGTPVENVTVKGSPRTVDILVAYLKKYPTRLRSIKLNVDNSEQLDEPIRFRQETPWKTYMEEERIPSDYQSQDTNNPNMSEVDDIKDWVLSDQATILYNVRAGRSVTLSFLFGATLDSAKALDKKANDAAQTVAAAYARRSN